MTLFEQIGWFKVWGRDLKDGSREFQVREGNRVVFRHAYLHEAIQEAHALHDAFWDEQAKQLRILR